MVHLFCDLRAKNFIQDQDTGKAKATKGPKNSKRLGRDHASMLGTRRASELTLRRVESGSRAEVPGLWDLSRCNQLL
jgi:hypothetical protein